MTYIDGLVIPVPTKKKKAYRRMAAEVAPLFKDHAALRRLSERTLGLPEATGSPAP